MTARHRRLFWLALASALLIPAVAFAAPSDAFTRALAKGPIYAALAALVGGLAVSLTPCVYPMIAVTVSIFGAKQAKSRGENMLLSAAFVLGIAATLIPLGVAAGISGGMFGSLLQSRGVIIGIAVLFVLMAASMFGAFELALPSSLNNKLAELGGIGYKGAFVLGSVCGLIATPCTGPVLTGILAWIASTQSASLGALAMGAFALGLGMPFFLVGAFAMQLPKSGRWMVHVKSGLGIVLLVVALYFLNNSFGFANPYISGSLAFIGACAGFAVLGLLFGAVHREFSEPGLGVKLGKGLGIVLATGGILAGLLGGIKPAEALTWERQNVDRAVERATRDGRPLLVDFTASWCGACKELDKKTFSEPRVGQELGRFVAVKVDATNGDDPVVTALMSRFKVVGLPTVVVLDSHGHEAARFNEFVAPDEFLRSVQRVD